MLGVKKQKLPLAEDIPPQEQILRGRFPPLCRSQTRGTSTFLSLADIFMVQKAVLRISETTSTNNISYSQTNSACLDGSSSNS